MIEFFLANLVLLFKMVLHSSLLTFWGFWLSVFQHSAAAAAADSYAAGSPPLQPTRAAQLLLDGVKIEPCTIIIMGMRVWQKADFFKFIYSFNQYRGQHLMEQGGEL
jgi:hypothetical protein